MDDPDEYYVESAADEIFSGPTHELVPSSYSSFHHQSYCGFLDQPRFIGSRRTSSLSRATTESLGSLHGDSDAGEIASFQFFTRDEVESAEGGTTVAGDYGDLDGMSIIGESVRYESPYIDGLLNHNTEANHEFDGGDEDERLLSETGDLRYASSRLHQKYYIAEEDLHIVCAGYAIVAWRQLLYQILSILSCGIFYLILRWAPRWRLRLTARKCPLGQCKLLVVENQWAELEFVEVNAREYNKPLSTIFNLESLKDEERYVMSSVGQPGHALRDAEAFVDCDPNIPSLRMFKYHYLTFIYNPLRDMFYTNCDWVDSGWADRNTASEGLDSETHAQRSAIFGLNALEIRQPSIFELVCNEVLHPFYIFQVASIVLWLCDDYFYYAAAIFVLTIVSVLDTIWETENSIKRLNEMAHNECEIRVLRSGFWTRTSSKNLVPGDVYELSDPNLTEIPCDSVLLSGDCILDESILTGESVLVSKSAADTANLAAMVSEGPNSIPRHFLFGGTKLTRVRKPAASNPDEDIFEVAQAMVVRTGFVTTKGSLVRSMMFPKPSSFKFYEDSYRYILAMTIFAIIGFGASAIGFMKMHLPTSFILIRALDLVTIIVPPALPATLSIGTNISMARLRKLQTFCVTPSRLNVGGRVDLACFDKTGTLTEDGLDVLGVHVYDTERQKFGPLLRTGLELPETPLQEALATCHELKTVNSEIVGDPLDEKMFEFSHWRFDESDNRGSRTFTSPSGSVQIQAVKLFEFIPALRRMSVVTVDGIHGITLLVKGAPEALLGICKPDTIPLNFDELLHQYTHRGYRVIACAYRAFDAIPDYSREALETELIFSGFIIFENRLKPTSRSVIRSLKQAKIRTIMCTGDNLLTAISVGRESHIIDAHTRVYAAHFKRATCRGSTLSWQCVDDANDLLNPDTLTPLQRQSEPYALAVSGDVFKYLVNSEAVETINSMLMRGTIFARMSPDEKHELVLKLQELDYTTCFCGDGANDCGALRAADIGISLSEAEASVAAPFMSCKFEISCVLDVIFEGRCALTTSFSCFKYMSLYSGIQFVSVSLLYQYGTNLGDFQFLWIDLFLILPIAIFMSWSGPSTKLSKKRPGSKLLSRKVLVPLIGFISILGLFQMVCWLYSRRQLWCIVPTLGDRDNTRNTYNTALFFMSSFQYIITGLVLCEGLPFRQPIGANTPFILTTAVTSATTLLFMFLDSAGWLGRLMDLTPTSGSFKLFVLTMVVLNLCAMLLCQRYVYPTLCEYIKRTKSYFGVTKTSKLYKQYLSETKV